MDTFQSLMNALAADIAHHGILSQDTTTKATKRATKSPGSVRGATTLLTVDSDNALISMIEDL